KGGQARKHTDRTFRELEVRVKQGDHRGHREQRHARARTAEPEQDERHERPCRGGAVRGRSFSLRTHRRHPNLSPAVPESRRLVRSLGGGRNRLLCLLLSSGSICAGDDTAVKKEVRQRHAGACCAPSSILRSWAARHGKKTNGGKDGRVGSGREL